MNNLIKLFSLAIIGTLSMAISCMEISNNNAEQIQAHSPLTQQPIMLDLNAIPLEKIKQKLETIQWLCKTIQPLNNGRLV
jgi:hypothetical protein